MKDRIKQFMLDKGMTQKALAAELCISEATLTGIFTGRTRPTVNIIDAFHQFFPEVNMYWLMYGEGEMYSSSAASSASSEGSSCESENSASASSSTASHSSSEARQALPAGAQEGAHYGDLFSASTPHNSAPHASMQVPQQMVVPQVIEKYIDKPRRKITEIRIFFDDGTYETFTS